MARPFFAYMFSCSDGSYYVGHTDNLQKRVAEHEYGAGRDYTSTRRPVRLVWWQDFPTREEAKAAEAQIKKWCRAKKQALIRGDFAALSVMGKKKDWAAYKERKARRTREYE